MRSVPNQASLRPVVCTLPMNDRMSDCVFSARPVILCIGRVSALKGKTRCFLQLPGLETPRMFAATLDLKMVRS